MFYWSKKQKAHVPLGWEKAEDFTLCIWELKISKQGLRRNNKKHFILGSYEVHAVWREGLLTLTEGKQIHRSVLLLFLVARVISERSVEEMMKSHTCMNWQDHSISWSGLEFISVTSEPLLQKFPFPSVIFLHLQLPPFLFFLFWFLFPLNSRNLMFTLFVFHWLYFSSYSVSDLCNLMLSILRSCSIFFFPVLQKESFHSFSSPAALQIFIFIPSTSCSQKGSSCYSDC